MFDTGPVIPTPIEDYDFASRRELLHVALKVHLTFFAVRWGRKSNLAENPGTDVLSYRTNCVSFSGCVAPFKNDDDSKLFVFHPVLEFAELCLKPSQFLLVFLAFGDPFYLRFLLVSH